MHRLQLWTVANILWLCFFFTVERLHEPMNISSFVYVMTSLLSITVLLIPRVSDRIEIVLFVVSLVLLLGLKSWLDYPTWGSALPITVTEALACGITIFLAGRLHRSVDAFQQAALRIAGASNLGLSTDFNEKQVDIFRELRLARNYERPLAVMTIAPQFGGNEQLMDKLVREVYRKAARQYVVGQLAELLLHATDGCATVAGRDDHLVVSLPEVDADSAKIMVEKIRKAAQSRLQIDLDVGCATFPDEELTLRGLLDRAEESMRSDTQQAPFPRHMCVPQSFPIVENQREM